MGEAPRGWSSFTARQQQLKGGSKLVEPAGEPFPALATQRTKTGNGPTPPSLEGYAAAVATSSDRVGAEAEPDFGNATSEARNWSAQGELGRDSSARSTAEVDLAAEREGEAQSQSESRSRELEPEEEDLYSRLRRDALRVSRAMSRHSRAASSAFERGDKHRAKQLSKQAKEERALVDQLSAQAAAEILKARNKDPWTIDLHGLHRKEAVAALEMKLAELESLLSESSSVPRYSKSLVSGSAASSSNRESPLNRSLNHEGLDLKDHTRLLHRELTIVTGLGVHSRDGPSLPNAVKSFLTDRRYRFWEPRSGTITVQLKHRFNKNHSEMET